MPSGGRRVTGHGSSLAINGQVKARDGRIISRQEIEGLPSMDSREYYDSPSPPSSLSDEDPFEANAAYNTQSNSGNKLKPNARWMRAGKLYAWGPEFEDAQTERLVRKRFRYCLEQLLPEAAADAGAVPPRNITTAIEKRKSRKRAREEEEEYILPHLRGSSPPRSTARLASLLALPQTYTDILVSTSMRHTLGEDTVESGLQRTAAELLEGEKGLMQALGRLREVLRVRERDVPDDPLVNGNGDAVPKANGQDGAAAVTGTDETPKEPDDWEIKALPHISDTDNLWRVTQELLQNQPPPTIVFTVTPSGAGATGPDQPVPTPVQRLFTCSTGLTVNAIPAATPSLLPKDHASRPQPVKYNLDLSNQCRAVDDALERIAELLADCNEYKERLEECRSRVADTARARKRVWSVIKERALAEMDRDEK